MVLGFSVMVLLFFSAVLPHCFYIMHFSHFKGCCWLRSVLYNHKKYIYIIFNTSLIMNVAESDVRASFSSSFFY